MTRQQNLFLLAHLCHVPAPQVDDLRVLDFAEYLAGIRQHVAANRPQPGRTGR